MAQNFKIHSRQTENSIHLNLAGDFDGNSACELLHAIEQLNRKKIPIPKHHSFMAALLNTIRRSPA